ncbi:MAG TPA: hypothetical protein VFR99_11890 [Marmoricola sp.]|nr:hypothetical protein [Marmoricola sp.]
MARASLAFVAWALVGALAALGVASLLTIGLVFLVCAAVLAGLLLWIRAARGWSPLGVGAGAAVVVGYIGWLNRGGPGNVCHPIERGVSCEEQWSPWPFFAVAVMLAVLAVAGFLVLRKRFPAV